METISTGEPANLETYRNIALALSLQNENSKAVKFIDKKIQADEREVIHLILTLIKEDLNDILQT